jgi:hypothetical protein
MTIQPSSIPAHFGENVASLLAASSHSLIGHNVDYDMSSISGGVSPTASPLLKPMAALSPPPMPKDTLMPKETCPVCGISITYKNLARHIKLRHKIKFKFCYKCRQLVPNTTFEEHKNGCEGQEVEQEDNEEAVDPTEFLDTSGSGTQGLVMVDEPMVVDDDEEEIVSGGEVDPKK